MLFSSSFTHCIGVNFKIIKTIKDWTEKRWAVKAKKFKLDIILKRKRYVLH
jgi:hypothetical protein